MIFCARGRVSGLHPADHQIIMACVTFAGAELYLTRVLQCHADHTNNNNHTSNFCSVGVLASRRQLQLGVRFLNFKYQPFETFQSTESLHQPQNPILFSVHREQPCLEQLADCISLRKGARLRPLEVNTTCSRFPNKVTRTRRKKFCPLAKSACLKAQKLRQTIVGFRPEHYGLQGFLIKPEGQQSSQSFQALKTSICSEAAMNGFVLQYLEPCKTGPQEHNL